MLRRVLWLPLTPPLAATTSSPSITSCPTARSARWPADRNTVVFGTGDPNADLMFVGEAPGFNEDKQGKPFVGQAGKLLDKLLAEIGLERGQCFIANVLKCRPPGNRDPQPAEIEACEGHLFRQIELIQPRVVCSLGNFATKLLSGRPEGITKVRGVPQVRELGGRTVFLYPIFHPAAALYTPAMLERLRGDFKALPDLLAQPLPNEAAARSRSPPRSRIRPRSGSLPGSRNASWSAPASRRTSSACSDAGTRLGAMPEQAFTSNSPQATERAARAVGARLRPGDVVLIAGDVGTGKTTWVRAACESLGVTDAVTSPSFTIGQLYRGRVPVSHVDLFRLESLDRRGPGAPVRLPDARPGDVHRVARRRNRGGGAAAGGSEARALTRGRRPAGDRSPRGRAIAGGDPGLPRAVTLIGFDTSMAVTVACVIPPSGEPVRTPAPDPQRLLGAPAHSAELLPILAELLEQGGTGWDDVTAIAVGVGPGTFTGLRIGVATARGLAQALGVPLHPVSSLAALAAGIAAGAGAAPGTPILPLIDAKRGQVFASLHRAGEPPQTRMGTPCPVSRRSGRAHRRCAANPVGRG